MPPTRARISKNNFVAYEEKSPSVTRSRFIPPRPITMDSNAEFNSAKGPSWKGFFTFVSGGILFIAILVGIVAGTNKLSAASITSKKDRKSK